MSTHELLQIAIFLTAIMICVKPLGWYMSQVYSSKPTLLTRVTGPLEKWLYKLAKVDPDAEMNWRQYAQAVLALSFVSIATVYAIQRAQSLLPLNPQSMTAVSADSSINTAISFATNTNWQSYGGESTMSHLTQMLALAVQNFVSAAAGMAVLVALIRGFSRQNCATIGNFWVDLTRGILHILVPASCVLALCLIWQGVPQTFAKYQQANLMESLTSEDGSTTSTQVIAVGPVASQVAIKQLGTNGGGYFNANSAHPLENPTPLSNLLQMVSILLIPAGLCWTFGDMIGDRRQGWAILAAMFVILLPLLGLTTYFELQSNPNLADMRVVGGNMEGKEVRLGIVNSSIWATATTAASNGSVNAMHDSFSPLGGLFPLWLIQLGEIVFGGVGSGLYGMLVFAIVAVFLSGLMVGRTPEYLGKKIAGFEIKMASLVILLPCAMVLVGTAIAVLLDSGQAGVSNPGPHGFSEILYAFSSAANNNGSAFAGLSANTPFYNGLLGLSMLIGRFWVMIPVLAIAGSLASKKTIPASNGTLPTHTPLFVLLLVAVIIVIGALSFFPALALGPIVEHLIQLQH
ncbi:MAG: potassium-transporting ATPase subunit KdpA [Pirellulales bacterium]